MNDASGNIISTEARAETLADYLERVQWRVRPVNIQPDPPAPIHHRLPVDDGLFTQKELRLAISKLSSGKACRDGDAPIECFKTLATQPSGIRLQEFLDLCNSCWAHGHVPKEWLVARVVMIFKKGDPASAGNYRPIALTVVAYRIYASMLKQRLLDVGLDQRLWSSQFGFRRNCSTEDAIFLARRYIELACAQRGGQVSLLALDWAKAFDSVHPRRLLQCLRRFGIEGKILKAIGGLVRERTFFVEDGGFRSTARPQRSGISQGCTLSPLFFVIVM